MRVIGTSDSGLGYIGSWEDQRLGQRGHVGEEKAEGIDDYGSPCRRSRNSQDELRHPVDDRHLQRRRMRW
jgi:hypothetical protein